MKDKEKQIEGITNTICESCNGRMGFCFYTKQPCEQVIEDATALYNAGYRKIPEDSVVIPKEISCYENIEKRVRTYRFDGNKVDFTNEQIMALTQIFHFKEKQENEIRKETAEKIFNALIGYTMEEDGWTWCISAENIQELTKQFGVEIKE